jgi:hypothetical protein
MSWAECTSWPTALLLCSQQTGRGPIPTPRHDVAAAGRATPPQVREPMRFCSPVQKVRLAESALNPATLPGRLLAITWMVASVIVIASFTAALTSQLTLKELRGTVHGEADLRYVRVAAIAGTETTEYLIANAFRIGFSPMLKRACRHCRKVRLMHWCMTGRVFCG